MFEEVRSHLQFKYYGQSGTPYLRATYANKGYEHSIIIALPEEVIKTIDQRIHESLMAMEAYGIENPEDTKPAEVVSTKMIPSSRTVATDSGTAIVTAKTPRQIEREAEDEADRLAM